MPWRAVKGWHLSDSEKSIIGDQKSIISARLFFAAGPTNPQKKSSIHNKTGYMPYISMNEHINLAFIVSSNYSMNVFVDQI